MLLRRLLLAALLLLSSLAFADEAAVKRAVEARLGGIRVDSVARTPYLGLYEVVIGEDIIYTDERVTYLINGAIIEASTRRNLTEERQQKLQTIKFSDLPLELAIKRVRGNGKRVVAVFSDPFCPYCRRLDQSLAQMDGVTIYTFLYPILRQNESPQMATRIWCAPDRAKAYYDFMLENKQPPAAGNCSAPVERWIALGQKLGVRATPVSFVTSGQRIVGARFPELQKLMDENVK
ncbi:MAG: DsbC family protein [Betaproteobacteria bacterium]|nr:DsbC family protein [Betaproteobacteria bacterium]MBI2960105.1 DsbC family protein [Betaproteobacteria bacterium]